MTRHHPDAHVIMEGLKPDPRTEARIAETAMRARRVAEGVGIDQSPGNLGALVMLAMLAKRGGVS